MVTSNPLTPEFHAVHSLVKEAAERALIRFNTPNWENTRNLLVQQTGYDPINDWIWNRRGMGVHQVHEKLNEILRVRHSFAHGFPVPAYSWTQSPNGRIRLTNRALLDVGAFFNLMVSVTDKGMQQHIELTYSIRLS